MLGLLVNEGLLMYRDFMPDDEELEVEFVCWDVLLDVVACVPRGGVDSNEGKGSRKSKDSSSNASRFVE
ncbi:unnamed protein product [Linum trigynum]|uniref:Uncharacterized protein n=1 Tax=Linum trigynum TaxID=586398 RepID=A0AAV2CKF2_9ROSI